MHGYAHMQAAGIHRYSVQSGTLVQYPCTTVVVLRRVVPCVRTEVRRRDCVVDSIMESLTLTSLAVPEVGLDYRPWLADDGVNRNNGSIRDS